jgi:hypothetical protein
MLDMCRVSLFFFPSIVGSFGTCFGCVETNYCLSCSCTNTNTRKGVISFGFVSTIRSHLGNKGSG